MNTVSEFLIALRSDLNITSTSSLFPHDTLVSALNRSYIKCARLFRWPQLEDAKKTSTQVNIEYYDFPETWSPDSIWRLEVDDVMYGEDPDGSPMDFNDYMIWKADNTTSTDKKWAVQHTRFFIYPTPTAVGSYNISVWGQKNVDTLTENDDVTVFSYNMPEVNEAIVLEAREILKLKGEDDRAKANEVFLSPRALGTLTNSFNKLKQEQAKYEKTQPFFEVDDMFGKSGVEDLIGRF